MEIKDLEHKGLNFVDIDSVNVNFTEGHKEILTSSPHFCFCFKKFTLLCIHKYVKYLVKFRSN